MIELSNHMIFDHMVWWFDHDHMNSHAKYPAVPSTRSISLCDYYVLYRLTFRPGIPKLLPNPVMETDSNGSINVEATRQLSIETRLLHTR